MTRQEEQIEYLYNNYGFKFPMTAKYKRDRNRIYFASDFKDGEDIEFFWMCEQPSSNARGNAFYKNADAYTRLIHISELS